MLEEVEPEGWCVGQLLADEHLARGITDLHRRATMAAGGSASGHRAVRGVGEAVSVLADCGDRLVATLQGPPRARRVAAGLLAEHAALGRRLTAETQSERERRSLRLRSAVARVRAVRGREDVFAAVVDQLAASGFDRVMLTRVRDGVGVPERYRLARDPDWADEILRVGQAHPMQLADLVHESQMVRRHGPVMANDVAVNPAVHRPLAEVTGCLSYVAAPVLVEGQVVAFLHADAHFQRRHVDADDRDAMWICAEAAGAALERGALRAQATTLRAGIARAAAAIAALAEEPAGPLPLVSEEDDAMAPARSSDPPLSRRELEVLELMAGGATNARIAQVLVLSPATVKTHVANILRKLGVSNRAQAAAQFSRLGRR
ncbi:MAG: hypothetical protein JWM31_1396 [Solirubrobacterales bacterium]|nr:hypothetical protein [Solirubrobacterales bacterium]